jgi:hypothetical protein
MKNKVEYSRIVTRQIPKQLHATSAKHLLEIMHKLQCLREAEANNTVLSESTDIALNLVMEELQTRSDELVVLAFDRVNAF